MRKRQKIDSLTSARRHLSPLPANIPRSRSNPNLKIQFKKSPKRLRSLSDERGEENQIESSRKSRRNLLSQDNSLGSRMRKRKRVEHSLRVTRTTDIIQEEEEDFESIVENQPNSERGMHKRRLRSRDVLDLDTGTEAEGEESEEELETQAEIEQAYQFNGDLSMTEHDLDDFHLTTASAKQLARLLRSDLVKLYSAASSTSAEDLEDLTKELLINGIMEARPNFNSYEVEEPDASPRPFTSAEGSIEEEPQFRSKSSKSKNRTGRHSVEPTSSKGSRSGGLRTRGSSSSIGFVTEESDDELSIISTSPVFESGPRIRSTSLPGSNRMAVPRKSGGERRGRHGRSVTDGAVKGKGKSRVSYDPEDDDWESVLPEEDLETSDDPLAATESIHPVGRKRSMSPIAHRTRHSVAPIPVPNPNGRIDRAAKRKAAEKIFGSAQVRAEEMEEDVEEEEAVEESDLMEESTEYEEVEEEDGEMANMSMDSLTLSSSPILTRRTSTATVTRLSSPVVPLRKTRNSRVDPSDGDIESGADDLEEEEEDGLDLKNATEKSLLRIKRDDLVKLCEDRALDGEGTKKDLVFALLGWRDKDEGGSPASDDSTDSNMTARAGNQTDNEDLPLLMQTDHHSSPEKPVTAKRSKLDEHEEVNALDLESLQLQDREIAFDKLTKLEKIGSGGFKDVYKGIYKKKSVAIADIRGHLTEMDIKELGLLRDLRHPNIVNFIGVSIPAQPSEVPVTIISELCANGDLFDYLRGVAHPTFLEMLKIMIGIARGLEYLHTRTPKIIHRDIKSSNVLITGSGIAKINDFGLARVKTSTKSMIRSLVGTVNWQAPELWVPHPRYNEKVDVYSVGLVYWEVLQWHQPQKRYPFEGLNEHAIYVDVGQKKLRPSTASMGRQWGLEIVELVDAMWTTDPANRPSMTQVVLELEILITSELAKGTTGRKKSK